MKTGSVKLFIVQIVIISLLKEIIECHPMNADEKQSTNRSCPQIIERASWSARNPSDSYLLLSSAPYVVVHHGGISEYCYNQLNCSQIVRSYQDLHMDRNGWIDIGYNYVIGEDGNVYEGRGWNYVGSHHPGYNNQSIGISIIGDFSNIIPNTKALDALNSLIACGVAIGKISGSYFVIGHRQDRNTTCPGQALFDYVKKMPRWTSSPVPVWHYTRTKNLTLVG